MKFFYSLAFLFLSTNLLFGQYLESFDVANKGIFNPGCGGAALTTCSTTDFTGVDWTMGGDLSGIDSEGFFTTGGALLGFDIDTRACWISPTIYIDNVIGTASFTVELEIPSSSSNWDNSPDDYMDVEYSIDGGAFVPIANVHGCPGSGHTVSGEGCGSLAAGTTFTAAASGLSGTTLIIQACLDANLSSEGGQINFVSVPEAGTTTVLPVELISFNAYDKGNIVQLDWMTASEINNDFFVVERSKDGISFESLERISGAGNSTEVKTYQFIDIAPFLGQETYYRLRQVDFDGSFEYSPIKVVKIEKSTHDIRIEPNPISSQALIHFDTPTKEQTTLSIYHINGQLVKQFVIAKDVHTFPLLTSEVPNGYYLLTLKSIVVNQTERIVIMN